MTIPTYHKGARNYGTGYDMMTRIDDMEAENARLRDALALADWALSGANINMHALKEKVDKALGLVKETREATK